MAQKNSVKIVQVSRVTPLLPDSAKIAELTLPLTFLDAFCFKFPPIKCVFFYTFTDDNSLETLIPKLKHSLSQALQYYLPLAGTLNWPPESPKPYALFRPGDAVSFTVAESGELFHHLADKRIIRPTSDSQTLVPELRIEETIASILAVQITLFPGAGFCVGFTAHHAFLDGKSAAVFMKSWAHLCKNFQNPNLPPELMPVFDRLVVKDPNGLETLYLDRWLAKTGSNTRLFEPWSDPDTDSDSVRGTFELSREEIEALKAAAFKCKQAPVSSLVAASAFVVSCMVRANSNNNNERLYFVIGVDYRTRLDPPIPENYFGNCSGSHIGHTSIKDSHDNEGFARVAAKMTCLIKGLAEKGSVLLGAEERLKKWGRLEEGAQVIAVTWSPRFGVYMTDFGFGRPERVEIVTVHGKAISIVELGCGDYGSGLEVGLALTNTQMDRFASIFRTTLSNITHHN